MQRSRGGMGSRKHGKSGSRNGAGKSPKMRLHERMNAEQDERKPRESKMFNSVKDAFLRA